MVERIAEKYKECVFSGGDGEEYLKKLSQSLEEKKPAQDVEELKREIAQLKQTLKAVREHSDEVELEGLRAATLLHEALKLKPNAGGKIKEKIREALQLIDDI
jgi:seryl-tRNA synthetase